MATNSTIVNGSIEGGILAGALMPMSVRAQEIQVKNRGLLWRKVFIMGPQH
jgi:hypothetical protein